MKFSSFPFSAFLVAACAQSVTDAYAYNTGSGGNFCRPPRDNWASSARAKIYRERLESVNNAFQELHREMNDAQNTKEDTTKGWKKMMNPFMGDFKEVDSETAKKWVDKAFEFASEFNQEFSNTPQERETNDEFIRKSREWIKQLYNVDGQESKGASESSYSMETADSSQTASTNDETRMPPYGPKEPRIETPYSENRSNEEMFQVAVDLPGVEKANIDISLEQDFLVIEAKRLPKNVGQQERKYIKKFAIIEDEIEVEKIEAALTDGVLVVSLPKKKREEKEPKRKINLE
jgi:HSP20 family protein